MPTLTTSALERVIDTTVQRRLCTDRAYQNAEDAETQAQREAEIVGEVEADLESRYSIEEDR